MSKLDPTHLGILRLLQEDARMTHKELAKRLKKSVSPIFERVKWLEQQGYIKGYTAIVDLQKSSNMIISYTHIQMNNHSEEALSAFQQAVIQFDEVMECYYITGNYDFILKIVSPDMKGYNDFLRGKVGKLPNVGNVQSFLVLSEEKRQASYPV
ncbi:transcriptional regulator, AsnC/Lrp family protein [Pedobacter sp. BAL39]|uniref:Lrp/AsnC family transcriptional regulator n=1 Tax=Pedobacter sp. BAL39 TaxID=391596 RepID=UPI0001559751|nr:Lrp/AsnC family transcriptional regulator [Pedobacter sp. BAL39]EDM35741.1 transcriptional regulator, AsnC/Lrp family protein [Pedobacter sp. BAL39]